MPGRGKRAEDRGKVLRSTDGRVFRVSQILFCEQLPDGSCRCLVHQLGWARFAGRSAVKMPAAKFNHCRSKFVAQEHRCVG